MARVHRAVHLHQVLHLYSRLPVTVFDAVSVKGNTVLEPEYVWLRVAGRPARDFEGVPGLFCEVLLGVERVAGEHRGRDVRELAILQVRELGGI